MITITQCITSARFAADAVWGQIGPGGFSWIECLTANRFQARLARKAEISPGIGCASLAQYITNNRGATAEQLFRFAIADHTDPASWDRAPPSLRAAVEIFRATFLVLLQLHEADAREMPKPVPVSVNDWRKAYSHNEIKEHLHKRKLAQAPPPPPVSAPERPAPAGDGVTDDTLALTVRENIIPILEERGRKYPRRNPTGGKA